MEIKEIQEKGEIYTVNNFPIIKAYADKIELVKVINTLIPSNKIVDHGTIVLSLVIDTLSGRSPLYILEDFYENQDIELLLGKKIRAEKLNDDSIARTLDAIHKYGSMKIFSACALKAVKIYDLETRYLHFDTTSKSVYGAYEGYIEDELKIIEGYSKDHRQDLKQLIIGILCVDRAIPIIGKVENGNESDKKINNKILTEISKRLAEEGVEKGAYIYVADSAMVTEENLKELGENYFITRLPATYKECERAISEAVKENKWEEIEEGGKSQTAKYKYQEKTIELYGKEYRGIVIHSSVNDKRRKRRIEKELEKLEKEIKKEIEKAGEIRYYCYADAEEASKRLKEKENKYYKIETEIREEEKYGRGRPKKGEERKTKEIMYYVEGKEKKKEEEIEKKREEAGCFVLLSNVPKEGDMGHNGSEILKVYKDQNGVERNFKFLKDPVIVNSIFLKKPSRIEALGLIFLISLLIWRLMERTMRKNAEEWDVELIGLNKRKTKKPTTYMMLRKFYGIMIIKIGEERTLGKALNKAQLDYLRVLEIGHEYFINSG